MEAEGNKTAAKKCWFPSAKLIGAEMLLRYFETGTIGFESETVTQIIRRRLRSADATLNTALQQALSQHLAISNPLSAPPG